MTRTDDINRIVEKLRRLWLRHPEQRLGQIIENYVIPSGSLRGSDTCWLFYAGDYQTEKNLDAELEEAK